MLCRDMKKARKEARRMVCICSPPTSDELSRGVRGCSEDCLNRMLMIEWYVVVFIRWSLDVRVSEYVDSYSTLSLTSDVLDALVSR